MNKNSPLSHLRPLFFQILDPLLGKLPKMYLTKNLKNGNMKWRKWEDDVNIINNKLIELLMDTGHKSVGLKTGQTRMIRNHTINRTIKLRNRCGRKW